MFHRWDQLTFLHWSYEPAVIQDLLPPGLTVDTFPTEAGEERAWVGLIPFLMEVSGSKGRSLKWPFRFPETNVRTYVLGPDGEPGIWFFSLESARMGAVPGARLTYRVPYFWARMKATRSGDVMRYVTQRRWPGPRGARSEVTVRIGAAYAPEELTSFDHFLTARWTLFGSWGGRLLMAHAVHPPWPLHRATVDWTDELIVADGIPAPVGDPAVHWSPGVDVRIGYPSRVR